MASLAQFLKTGMLGPVALGMSPADVVGQIGDPDQQSSKTNPLILKYGSLQLVFWRHGPKSQLLDIDLNFLPKFEPLPPAIALTDFQPPHQPTTSDFRDFVRKIGYLPAHSDDEINPKELVFLSGVIAEFIDTLLKRIRLQQKEKREIPRGSLSDIREPSIRQIAEMIQESERLLQLESQRSALVMAWAGLEASLRRAALWLGRRGQIGVQPTILVRELLSEGVLSVEEGRFLERLRQLRTTIVHGLAPEDFSPHVIEEMNTLSRRILGDQQNTENLGSRD
jgi:hypothetical protein